MSEENLDINNGELNARDIIKMAQEAPKDSSEPRKISLDFKLTDQQKKSIVDIWNEAAPDKPPSVQDIADKIFGRKVDARSTEGRAIRNYLASLKLKPKMAAEYFKKGIIELTEEQRDFVKNNCPYMSTVQMARELFNNKKITNLHQEYFTIEDFMRQEGLKKLPEQETISSVRYTPPKSVDRVLGKINRYTKLGLEKDKLTSRQKKEIASLTNYLGTFRFCHQMNNFESIEERELFEDSFIRYTYDKSDLEQEELDTYVVLCTQVVLAAGILAQKRTFQRMLDSITNEERQNGENAKISMGLVEAISNSQEEYNQCVARYQNLLKSLKVERSKKESERSGAALSLFNFVEMWKEEEKRKQIITLNMKRQEKVKEEFDKLSSMEQLKALIAGVSLEEVLNG